MSKPGAFIISLDFELHWGLFDHTPLDAQSRAYFDRTRQLIPPTLEIFADYGVRATWATVGMLYANSKAELLELLPRLRPQYDNPRLDPYRLLNSVGENEEADPYHFAPSLIAKVRDTPGQHLGSHTFGHYYCLETGQTAETFRADLEATQTASRSRGYADATSLVFPRNQYRADYFPALTANGFTAYRGNPDRWFWQTRSGRDTTPWQRAFRLADNYLDTGGTTLFGSIEPQPDGLSNVPSSRFFRPYLAHLDGFGGQQLKLRRIRREMEEAARSRKNYHLWWHPHNLATHPTKNMAALREIMLHYRHLQQRYGWESHSMESFVQQSTPSRP